MVYPHLTYDYDVARKAELVLRNHHSYLTDCLKSVLDSLMFNNSHTLHPRRLREIGVEQSQRFLSFLVNADVAAVTVYGKQLAQDGLGYKSMVQMCGCLSPFCCEKLSSESIELQSSAIKAANMYITAAMDGFLEEYTVQLKKDQLYIREAFNKVAASGQ
ncbi:hypothetical protein JW960_11000 [candidate division KSB1 bacterium]|nr:hypothetical protein [candidate division KSB1 bacterium]